MKTIGILNGPNLGRLGKREPEVYGSETLADLEARLRKEAAALGVEIECFQSNAEGALIDKIEQWADAGVAGAVFNPGGLTHTSVALRDAISGSGITFVETHISHIHKRETFRHQSMTVGACEAMVSGMGLDGYSAALAWLANRVG